MCCFFLLSSDQITRKCATKLSDTGSIIPGYWQDLGHFSGHFGAGRNRNDSGVKGGYKRNKLQQKYVMRLPTFDQDLDSRKTADGIQSA